MHRRFLRLWITGATICAMSRLIVSCGIALTFAAGAGCAGKKAALRSQNSELRSEVATLKAQRRHDRRSLRDLERQIVLEEQVRPDHLPVAVVGPEPAAAAVEVSPASSVDDVAESGEQIAYADDEIEIVYVGEAAKDESVRPTIKLHQRHERTRYKPAARKPVARARVGERIAVTRGKVPSLPRERSAAALRPARRAAAPDPRALYKQHYQALRDGKHSAARKGFRAFVADYPKHDYADNAQYWLGEAYYDERDYERARAEFSRVSTLFPKGNKVSDALLKTAYCHEHLGDSARARSLLSKVIERFPKSNAAVLAAARLVKLQAVN